MKAYKITGKLGDICSFVGGNEVKKGDMVYFHSESDMKQQCVAKTQENDMSIEAMKQWLEAFEKHGHAWLHHEKQYADAITSLRQAIANEALNRMAENEQDLGIQMKRCDCAAHSAVECVCGAWDKPVAQQAEKQQPFGYLWPTGRHPEFRFTQQLRDGVEGTPVYTAPQPQEEHHAKDCALLQIPSRDCDCSQNQEQEPWVWQQAPIKTQWGHDMVVADLAIDKDHTVSVYCERDQTARVEAMFKGKNT
jgi:hypothetical protein